VNGTGVYATVDEIESLRQALSAPAIALQCGSPVSPDVMCHSMALAHGLPEVTGYYGIDLRTREFMQAVR
jgi:hypothetical protein